MALYTFPSLPIALEPRPTAILPAQRNCPMARIRRREIHVPSTSATTGVMTDDVAPKATSKAAHRLGYLERLSKAQSATESAVKSKYITPRSLFKRPSSGVESAGNQLVGCINSKALQLRETIENADTFSNDTTQHIENFLGVLENSIRAVKTSMSGLHWDGSTIEETIRTCQQNIETAWASLTPTLPPSTALPGGSHTQQTESAVEESPPEGSTIPLRTELPKPKTSELIGKSNPDATELEGEGDSEAKATWTKLLEPSKTILKYVGAATPLIPVVGQFIQCGVDVGNAIIDMLDGMTQNAQSIRRLVKRVTRLSSMADIFKDDKRSYCTTDAGTRYLEEFRRLCDLVQPDIRKLRSQNPAGKLVFSSDNTGTIEDLNGKIDDALEQLDLYLRLNADHMLKDLEEARLIALLGDGDYGNKGHKEDDGLCLKGTREAVLHTLDVWADDPSAPNVLLLHGQAGRGKSTIAKTASRRYAADPNKKASSAIFFFQRGKDARNARIMLALALQLVHYGESRVKQAILQAIKDQPGVASSSPEEQFRVLLVEPLKKLESDPPPVMLVMDALDECGDRDYSFSLLTIIAQYSLSLPSTVKVLITSRPERDIVPQFQERMKNGKVEDLDVIDTRKDVTSVERDLHAYFEARLSAVRPSSGWQGVGPGTVDQLVVMAQGLFQWASTAIEFIAQAPTTRLQKLLQSGSSVVGSLPTLYRQILEEALPEESTVSDEMIQHVLGSLVAAPGSVSLTTLVYLWNEHPDALPSVDALSDIRDEILNHLRSLIMVPTSPNDPIQFLHTSVRDFLVTEKQCRDPRFFIAAEQHHRRLATVCLERMKSDLTDFNIDTVCGPNQTSAEVRDDFRKAVSVGLVYCALSWSAHLSQVPRDEVGAACLDLLDEFCRTNLIHWMETLSLAEVAHEIILMTKQGKDWIGQDEMNAKTYELLDDTQRLCRQYFEIISTRPYHISRSVLLHCPLETTLRHVYSLGNGTPRIRRGPVYTNWPNILWTKFVGAGVWSVAFSPDGRSIVSGSDDGTIRLWDIESGAQIGTPLTGHTDTVKSVGFSPDGKTIASGSDDKTVRLWDVDSRAQIGAPLAGHTGHITSVVFAPNGKTIASGSYDETIRFWNVENRAQSGTPLTGHTDTVWSVAFSHDGKIIASGSGDKTVRLWRVNSKAQIGTPLTGHTNHVLGVAFSHDSKTIASGSLDSTVRLWNVESGAQIGAPLTGHTGPVKTVVFSQDDKTIASGSGDKTILLWDVKNGVQIGSPLTGHAEWVRSVGFSCDGKTLVSGSTDKTVRLWNVKSEAQIGTPLIGHTDTVRGVRFSHGSETIASGSDDGTVRLWSLESGVQIEQVESHSVNDLPSFEPDQAGSIVSESQQITLHGSASGGDMVGWVFCNGVRRFWLPREWYVEPPLGIYGFDSETLGVSLSKNILVIHHRNIHILDISEII